MLKEQLESTQLDRKNQVLGDIRKALGREGDSKIDPAAVQLEYEKIRQAEVPRPVVDGVLIERFLEKHTAVHGTYRIVESYSQVPDAVAEFLNENKLPTEMVMGKTSFLSNIDWPQDWKIHNRSAVKVDRVSVTGAVCAIAETGTVVIVSEPEVSSTHLYLPENHIAVFDAGQIVRHLEDALQMLSANILETSRGVHMITGPSKTADVEQTIQYGAHGPRRLHTIVISTSN